MFTLRAPLLLLLCLGICIPWWFILRTIPQGQKYITLLHNTDWLTLQEDHWVSKRCGALSTGRPRGCMLQSYNEDKVRTCLSLQLLTVHGGTAAQRVISTVAEALKSHNATGIKENVVSEDLDGTLYNVTIFHYGSAEIASHDQRVLDLNDYYIGYQSPRPFEHFNDEHEYPFSHPSFAITATNQKFPLNQDQIQSYPRAFYFYEDELHSSSAQAQVLLNCYCNKLLGPGLKQTQAYCCAGYASPSLLQKLFLVGGSCAILVHLSFSVLWGNSVEVRDNKSRRAVETRRLLSAIATISAAVIICFVADRTALLDRTSKVVDLASFVWLTAIALLAGLATLSSHRAPDFENDGKDNPLEAPGSLSKHQTEEWKGWMQIMILLYHYFGMSKVLRVYQIVRLLVSSYLFMTAFGHATYFITTNDFSFRRIVSVLLRTNLLNIILALVLESQYDLYYFPVLTSSWFLIIWATIPRTAIPGTDVRLYIRRIVISAALVTLALQGSILVMPCWTYIGGLRLMLPLLDGREFLFRFGLDAYIPYIGMAAAVLSARLKASDDLPQACLQWSPAPWSKLESRFAISASLLVLPAYALFCHNFSDKILFNQWHPFVSPLPVIAFVVLRNSTRKMRASHSRLFAWFGRCSLETFVLQYHIWLGANSHGQLRIGLFKNLIESAPLKPFLNLLETIIIFAAFVSISSAASRALTVLTKVLVDLKAKLLLVFIGLWMVNLAAVMFPVLSEHHYHY